MWCFVPVMSRSSCSRCAVGPTHGVSSANITTLPCALSHRSSSVRTASAAFSQTKPSPSPRVVVQVFRASTGLAKPMWQGSRQIPGRSCTAPGGRRGLRKSAQVRTWFGSSSLDAALATAFSSPASSASRANSLAGARSPGSAPCKSTVPCHASAAALSLAVRASLPCVTLVPIVAPDASITRRRGRGSPPEVGPPPLVILLANGDKGAASPLAAGDSDAWDRHKFTMCVVV
mmetsp:Transcript_14449/g.38311  ORF Transcript_14449/g.38311 Transcript_14449/m.38311 type:complete len:232 (+) Transcript_14449:842-1537(+)